MKTRMLIWLLEDCGTPENLVKVCHTYDIDGVDVKLLDGAVKYNFQHGDAWIRSYAEACRNADPPISFNGWSYNYLEQPGLQGDMIMERCEKFQIDEWQLNIEKEFKLPGAGDAFIRIVEKLQERGFEVLVCSYRFPMSHPQLPWARMNARVEVDGWAPQVYWALNNNPVDQLEQSLAQYKDFSEKPIYPMGPLFGQAFLVRQPDGTYKSVYWEPTLEELAAFRAKCISLGKSKMYAFRLDWAIKRSRWDMLGAITGQNVPEPPVEPPPDPEVPKHVRIVGLNDDETLNMRNMAMGDIVAMTWNGAEFYPSEATKDELGRKWFRVGDDIFIASWYTEVIPSTAVKARAKEKTK